MELAIVPNLQLQRKAALIYQKIGGKKWNSKNSASDDREVYTEANEELRYVVYGIFFVLSEKISCGF